MSAANPCTAVIAALPEEMRAVSSRLHDRRTIGRGVLRGTLAGQPVVCGVTGDGAVRARRHLESFLDNVRTSAPECEVTSMVVIGVSGALSAGLAVGQVLVGHEVQDLNGPAPAPDPEWLEAAEALPGVVVGSLWTSQNLVSSPAARALLDERTGLLPAAVDLESATFSRVAAERNIPHVILRAISDTAAESLPDFLVRCQGEDGHVSRRRVARAAAVAPWRIPRLLQLAHRVRRCSDRLAGSVEALLAAKGDER